MIAHQKHQQNYINYQIQDKIKISKPGIQACLRHLNGIAREKANKNVMVGRINKRDMIYINLEYIYLLTEQKLNFMSSHSFFACCRGFSTAEDSEGSYSSFFRNNAIKKKKLNSINSPKASLKSMSSIRSFKNLQGVLQINQSHMVSTTDSIKKITPTILKPVSSNTVGSQKCLRTKPNRQVFLSPSIGKQLVRTPSMGKQKIHFSYNDPRNPQNRLSIPCTPTKNFDDDISDRIVGREKTWQQLETCENEPEMQIQVKKKADVKGGKNQAKKEISNNGKNSLNSSKLNLGGSIFTVLSEEVIEQVAKQQKEVRMQQSAIILNVFNPTRSQIQKWEVQPAGKVSRQAKREDYKNL